MDNPFQGFWIFIYAVGTHSVTLAAGCIVTFMVGIIEKHILKRPLSIKAEIAVLLTFVFFACFQAWRDEYRRSEKLQMTLNQKPSQPTIQVSIPPIIVPPAQVIQSPQSNTSVVPSMDRGNLRDRASDLSREIFSFLRMRDGILESFYQQQKPGSNRWDVYGPWIHSTNGIFRSLYAPRVFAIRNESASLHVIDTELDKELRLLQLPAGQTGTAEAYIPGEDSIKKIAERLAVLATQMSKEQKQ